VYIPPVETETHGRVILDGSMGYIGLVKKPLELGFEKGYLTYIEPTEDGKKLRDFMESFGDPEMYCAAELGIGLNQLSRCRGSSYIEDESAYRTFHIGFGRNLALGGDHNAAGHFDIVVHNPTIITGESVLMKDGESCAWF
jgi:leucyl aminopeptidase (aminopeptidase T)